MQGKARLRGLERIMYSNHKPPAMQSKARLRVTRAPTATISTIGYWLSAIGYRLLAIGYDKPSVEYRITPPAKTVLD